MFAILINEKGGEQKRLDFDKSEVTIGRVQGNDIILPKGNVSKRHSRIVLKDGKFIIVDLKSTNGTYVNGRKITSPLVVKSSDKIYIGDFILAIEDAAGAPAGEEAGAAAGPAPPRPAPPPPPRPGTRPAMPPATGPAAAVPQDEPSAVDVAAGSDEPSDVPGEEPATPAPGPARVAPPTGRPSMPNLPPRTSPRNEIAPRQAPPAAEARPTAANDLLPSPRPDRPDRPDRPERPEPPPTRPPGGPAPARETSPPTTQPAPALGSGLDSRVVAADRISDKATVMASDNRAPAGAGSSMPAAAPAAARATITRAGGGGPSTTAPVRQAPARAPIQARTTVPPQAPVDDPQRRRHVDLLNQVVGKAVEQLGLHALTPEQYADSSLPARVENAVGDIVDKMTPLPIGFDADPLTKEAVAEIVGAGPLDELLADETVYEIAVSNHDRIYVDRGSGQALSEKVFSSSAGVMRAINKLVSRAGARLDGTLGEVRLETGALLQAALPPHARVPSLIVKRSRKTGGRLQDLVNQGVLSAAMAEYLELCMRERRNFIVSGYGRGVMMGALGGATSAGARVVTVEPVSELDLSATAAGWIGLIGRGTDTRNVIGHAVRLHPDHLIITDVRGPEALDVAAALCGGQGVVVGVDAASARDAIARLESLGRLSGESPPRKALREELAQGLHLALHVGRTAAGAYRVMEISEVTLAEEGGVEVIAMFSFKPEGGDGQFVSTGHVPAFAG